MDNKDDEIEELKARLAALEREKSGGAPPLSQPHPPSGQAGGGCGQYFAIGLLVLGLLYVVAQWAGSGDVAGESYSSPSWAPPEGYVRTYNARGSQVGTKWDRPTSQECRGSGVTCYALEVITEKDCLRGLYAEITLLDANGRNIGWTNDTAQGVRAGEQTRLVFDTYERGVRSARIAEINCH